MLGCMSLCRGSTPLLRRADVDSDAPSTVDGFLRLGRFGKDGSVPGWPTLAPLLALGLLAYGMPAMLILQPAFLDDKLRSEWFGDRPESEGKFALTVVNMTFFAVWGVGSLLVSYMADQYGRKLTVICCALSCFTLAFSCALAPSFAVYACCRVLLGVPAGGIGGVSTYVLLIEWALPSDNAMLTSVLMLLWSLCAVLFVGLIAATDALGYSWRVQQAILALLSMSSLPTMPWVLESPRFHMANGRVDVAEQLLVRACTRAGIYVPEGAALRPLASTAAPSDDTAAHTAGASPSSDPVEHPESSSAPAGFAPAAVPASASTALGAHSTAATVPPSLVPPPAPTAGALEPAVEEDAADATVKTPGAGRVNTGCAAVPDAQPSGGGASHPMSRPAADATYVEPSEGGGQGRPVRPSYALLWERRTLYHMLLVGLNWLAVSLLFYGLDFAVGTCVAADGCNRYVNAASTYAADLPGYIAGSLLADTRLGRRLTAAFSLMLGGLCLLLTAAITVLHATPSNPQAVTPPGASTSIAVLDSGDAAKALGDTAIHVLTLAGKLCAASAFIQAYLFPAELFPTAIRGAALGVGNIFGRLGTTLAPVAATLPPLVVQLSLGSLSLLVGLSTTLLPESRGHTLPD